MMLHIHTIPVGPGTAVCAYAPVNRTRKEREKKRKKRERKKRRQTRKKGKREGESENQAPDEGVRAALRYVATFMVWEDIHHENQGHAQSEDFGQRAPPPP